MATLAHAHEAFSLVSRYLPDDISTVHDYGFGDGAGTQWLNSRYSNVVGYDITMEHAERRQTTGVDLRIGDVRYPQDDADLIYVGHILEGVHYQYTDQPVLVERLRTHCRYLLLQVHHDQGDVWAWQDSFVTSAIVHSDYTCGLGRADSVTLLRGYLP